ncbi:MAG: ABC transporter substrate-binding protein [Aurantimicrobium sp.]|uniref:ABC transporter substrate-binding protein n=1 Tax=Aurantimicrobium sp. TaxID=1930784 RepID=UPI002FCBCEA0
MLSKKKMIAAMVGIVSLAAAMTGCASGSSDSASSDKLYIALESKGFQHQFWQAVKAGAEQAGEEFGVEVSFDGPDTEADVDQQLQQLQTILDKNPSAIGIAALDSKAVAPMLQQAKDRKIPVIAFDSGVDSDIPLTTAATDNTAAAAEAAKHMVEAIGGSGEVAVIGHDQTSTTGVQRVDGFVNYIKKNAPGVKIVDVQYAGGDQLKSADAAKALIAAYPNLKGLYGTNEGSAIGIVNGVKELGLSGLTIIGFDSGKAQIDAINSGLMTGAITQNPVGIGYETVKAAVEAIKGKKLPKTIDTGYYWYDKSNINDAKIQAVLYQ